MRTMTYQQADERACLSLVKDLNDKLQAGEQPSDMERKTMQVCARIGEVWYHVYSQQDRPSD